MKVSNEDGIFLFSICVILECRLDVIIQVTVNILCKECYKSIPFWILGLDGLEVALLIS